MFGPTRALYNVSMTVPKGGVFGLAGENGAGKSTLIKILAGVHYPDEGRIFYDGRAYRPRNPEAAERAGIRVFHQEIPICPNLSIAANVFLGPAMPRKGISPDWKTMNAQCVDLYRTLLSEEIDPRRLIRDCTAAEKQLALLVRVLSRSAKLVILDEPTTALTPLEVDRLFTIIERLKNQGITFVFVSHMIEELTRLADTIMVLRDGQTVGNLEKSEFDQRTLSQMIAGRTLSGRTGKRGLGSSDVCLEVRELTLPGEFTNISFQLRRGEVLGLAGLQGSGRSSLARALFGAPPAVSGQIVVDGSPARVSTPIDAVEAGIGYIPEDRRTLGLFSDLNVTLNLCMAGIDRFSPRSGFLDRRNLQQVAEQMRQKLSIKMTSVTAPVRSLSGGNQQKVLISRWLALKPRVLVMNEPTRGVDVGAKQEISELIVRLSEEGYSFVVSSYELDELLSLSHRILVLNRGRATQEFAATDVTKEELLLAASLSEDAVRRRSV